MPRLEIRSFDADAAYRERTLDVVRRGLVCGFCIFKGSVERTKEVLAELQSLALASSGMPLLFSCDAEWGLPMRLDGPATEFPHALALAHSRRPNAVRDAARAIGEEMRSVGLHWSFAPVADVNSDPDNPIINIRSFGEDPQRVSEAAIQYAAGLKEAGIISCAKHFPGHGETRVDSHRALPVLDIPVERFERVEFVPFRALIATGIPAIMTGHLAAPRRARSLGAGDVDAAMPASVSPYLTRTLLRERFGFGGVIVTDSMEMGGLKGIFKSDAEAAEAALAAGNDIVLMPGDIEAVHEHLCKRYSEDADFAASVDASAARVEKLAGSAASGMNVDGVDLNANAALAEAIAEAAIDVTGNTATLHSAKFACIVADDPALQRAHTEVLEKQLRERLPQLRLVTTRDIEAEMASELVVFVLERPRGRLLDESGAPSVQSPVRHFQQLCQKLGLSPRCIIFLGNPYLVRAFEPAAGECRAFAYSDSAPSIAASVRWLQTQLP